MRYFIDTNILIYATQEDCIEHKAAKKFLTNLIENNASISLSWSVIYEYLRVITHHKVFSHPLAIDVAWQNINSLIDLDNVSVLSPGKQHQVYLQEVLQRFKSKARGNLLHDIHIAVLILEYGIKEIITADNDFRMFEFIKVTNPLISD